VSPNAGVPSVSTSSGRRSASLPEAGSVPDVRTDRQGHSLLPRLNAGPEAPGNCSSEWSDPDRPHRCNKLQTRRTRDECAEHCSCLSQKPSPNPLRWSFREIGPVEHWLRWFAAHNRESTLQFPSPPERPSETGHCASASLQRCFCPGWDMYGRLQEWRPRRLDCRPPLAGRRTSRSASRRPVAGLQPVGFPNSEAVSSQTSFVNFTRLWIIVEGVNKFPSWVRRGGAKRRGGSEAKSCSSAAWEPPLAWLLRNHAALLTQEGRPRVHRTLHLPPITVPIRSVSAKNEFRNARTSPKSGTPLRWCSAVRMFFRDSRKQLCISMTVQPAPSVTAVHSLQHTPPQAPAVIRTTGIILLHSVLKRQWIWMTTAQVLSFLLESLTHSGMEWNAEKARSTEPVQGWSEAAMQFAPRNTMNRP